MADSGSEQQVEIQAIFAYLDDLLAALKAVRRQRLSISAVYAPTLCEEIGELLEEKASPVRYFTLCGAILGILTGFGLSVYTALQWKFIVSGKPPVPRVPYVIESFEFCILFGVLFTLGGLLFLNRLPKWKLPSHYDCRVTEDRFSLVVRCPEGQAATVTGLLRESGAEEVHDVA